MPHPEVGPEQNGTFDAALPPAHSDVVCGDVLDAMNYHLDAQPPRYEAAWRIGTDHLASGMRENAGEGGECGDYQVYFALATAAYGLRRIGPMIRHGFRGFCLLLDQAETAYPELNMFEHRLY